MFNIYTNKQQIKYESQCNIERYYRVIKPIYHANIFLHFVIAYQSLLIIIIYDVNDMHEFNLAVYTVIFIMHVRFCVV